jgi:hypothetical protein
VLPEDENALLDASSSEESGSSGESESSESAPAAMDEGQVRMSAVALLQQQLT